MRMRLKVGAVTMALAVAIVVSIRPDTAGASDFESPGLGGAQLKVTPSDDLQDVATVQVEGKGFTTGAVAGIFVCESYIKPNSNVALVSMHCNTLGTAQTDTTGAFTFGGTVTSNQWFTYSSKCGGTQAIPPQIENIGVVDCELLAETFNATTFEAQSGARHHLCFSGVPCYYTALPSTTSSTSTSTTTSTTAPPPPQHHAVADFDGNGSTDISVFRPSEGNWYVRNGTSLGWGASGDIPVPADYDGDGKTDIAIFRPSTGLWAIHPSAGGSDIFVTYGVGSDIPVVADYDGDGRADIAIWRPDTGTWWIRRSSDGVDVAVTYGISGDVPVPGDYDGDGHADLGIFRSGTWFAHSLVTNNDTATGYGSSGDIPVPGEYDGDSHADMAVFRPSSGTWFIHHSSDGSDSAFNLGASGDIPVPGDYDGDGRTDAAIYHPADGTWHLADGTTAQWGNSTDVVLPLPYSIRQAFFGP
jgi:hypothetical protein